MKFNPQSHNHNTILRCARYAFAPNYYRYCGPDKNRTILDYINDNASDEGLIREIKDFHVLYPYLLHIAHENTITDPFNPRVVDAYWIGNSLLDRISTVGTINHLNIDQKLQKKLPKKSLKWLVDTIPKGAKLHHSFHVFSVFTRTGHHMVEHTVGSMNECRIGWGKVVSNEKCKMKNVKLSIKTQKLDYKNGTLVFIPEIREVTVPFKDSNSYHIGDWVTYHWGMVCEKVNEHVVNRLSTITKHNLRIANTIL